jgi:hypothetical protein
MRVERRRAARRSIALLLSLGTLQLGCGSDDTDEPTPEVTKDAGGATATDSGNKPAGPNIPKTFVVGCLDTQLNLCSEFLGAQSSDNDIMAGAKESCAQATEKLQTTRCKTEDLVGSCLSFGDVAGATRWVQKFYYAPLTEAQVKTRCQSSQFVPPAT